MFNIIFGDNTLRFNFTYGGIEAKQLYNEGKCIKNTVLLSGSDENVKKYENTYIFCGELKVTEYIDFYNEYDSVKWVLYFENIANHETSVIENLVDCQVLFPVNKNYKPSKPGHRMLDEDCAKVFRTVGSNWARDEYRAVPEFCRPDQTLKYSCSGGRSAQGLAPYFDINRNEYGYLAAIGWTGQWNASFTGIENNILLSTGIEDLKFYMLPGEKFRTSSVILTSYDNGQNEGHVKFRRLIKKYFSIMGKPGRPENGPLSFTAWGALSTEKMIHRLNEFKKHNLGAEMYWIDAGWYGYSSGSCPNEHVGDWGSHTGSWNINENYHPDKLLDVANKTKECDMDLLLWIEPERVLANTDTPKAHPEWFIDLGDNNPTWLLNLGIDEAMYGTFDMIAEHIKNLQLKCYRQDFNCDPLAFWKKNDEYNRFGITEIKHINNLYKLWDMLLEKFPDIFIDNCASGGRRNDFEMLSRSFPLWRSDYQCTFNCDPETAQIHNTGISWWLPYHGTGLGPYIGDKYRIRSSYGPSLCASYWMYDDSEISDDQPLEMLSEIFSEYKSVREYLTCDYYPLTGNSLCDTSWCAWQFNRPENDDGIILAFRRPESPMTEASFRLCGLNKDYNYSFFDKDDHTTIVFNGCFIEKNGYNLRIQNARDSKLVFYKKI